MQTTWTGALRNETGQQTSRGFRAWKYVIEGILKEIRD
jgi:hypothetical protein